MAFFGTLPFSDATSFFFTNLPNFMQKRNSKMRRTLEKQQIEFDRIPHEDVCNKIALLARIHHTIQNYPSAVEDILKDITQILFAADLTSCREPLDPIHLQHFLDQHPQFTGRVENSFLLALGYKYDVYYLRLVSMLQTLRINERKDWNSVFKYIINPVNARRRLYLGIFGPYIAELNRFWIPKTVHQIELANMAVKLAITFHCQPLNETEYFSQHGYSCAQLYLLGAKNATGEEVSVALTRRHDRAVSEAFIERLIGLQ
jgi:hypothetical protein